MPSAVPPQQDPEKRPTSLVRRVSREEFERTRPDHKKAREKAEKAQYDQPEAEPQQADEPEAQSTTTTGDVELCCNGHGSEYRPQGLPSGYSWYEANKPPMDGLKPCPAGWTSATAYWVLYPRDFVAEGKPNQPWVGGFMFIKDCYLYLHKKTGGWDVHQDPDNPANCARMDGPQTGNQGYGLPCPKQPDGSYKIELPPLNYCNHGWPQHRAQFEANKYDHAFSIMKFKLSNPDSDFVAMPGVDWWQNPSAPYPQNMGTGVGAWTLTDADGWTEIYCTQMLLADFERDPPPGVTKGAAGSGGGTDPGPEPTPTGDTIEISVDGNVLGDGSMVTFKVKKGK